MTNEKASGGSKIPSVLGMIGDIGWYGLVPSVQKVLGVVLLPIYTRYLTPEDYGVYALVVLAVGIPALLADWGVTFAILRDYLDYTGDDAKEFLFTSLVFKLFVSAMAFGSLLWLGDQLIPWLMPAWEERYRFYLQLAVVAAILRGIGSVTSTFLIIERRPQVYSFFEAVVYIATTGVQLYLLVGRHLGVLALFYAELLATCIVTIGSASILWPHLKARLRLDAMKAVLEYGWQTVPLDGLAYILRQADRWIIQYSLPLSQLGLYSFGAKFQAVASIYGDTVKKGWRPIYLRQLKENVGREELIKYGNTMFEVSLLVILVGVLFSKEVVQILAAPEYHSTYIVASILVGQVFFQKIVTFVGHNSMVYEKKLYFGIATTIATSALNVGLTLALVPRLGIEGAAMATLLAFVAGAVLTNVWATRYTQVGCAVDWPRWLSLTGLASLVSSPAFFLAAWDLWPLLALKAGLLLAFAGLIAVLEWERLDRLVKYLAPKFLAVMER